MYHAIRNLPFVNVEKAPGLSTVFELIVVLDYSFAFLLPLFALPRKANEQNKDFFD